MQSIDNLSQVLNNLFLRKNRLQGCLEIIFSISFFYFHILFYVLFLYLLGKMEHYESEAHPRRRISLIRDVTE